MFNTIKTKLFTTREREREREGVCVCECMCVCSRARGCVYTSIICVCACVRACVRVRARALVCRKQYKRTTTYAHISLEECLYEGSARLYRHTLVHTSGTQTTHSRAEVNWSLKCYQTAQRVLPPRCEGQVSPENLSVGLCCAALWCVCCLLYTSPSPRDSGISRMPSSA